MGEGEGRCVEVRVVGGGGMCGEVLGKVRKSLGGWGQGSWSGETGVGGGVRGVEVGGLGSGKLESGGLGSENLELGAWGRQSCGWGWSQKSWGRGVGSK